MYRLFLRLITALVTFILSLLLTWLLSIINRPAGQVEIQKQEIKLLQTAQRKYEMVQAGRSQTADGHGMSFTNYETSDGMFFSKSIEFYDSAQQAGKKLREQLKGGKVIRREPNVDETGKRIGECVVVKYASGNPQIGAAILCTKNSSLIITDSTSLENILEYLKDREREK